jgi:signal peptidase I
MEPSFYRGDILFITWDYGTPMSGDIVVYKIPHQPIPIVHRVISTQLLYIYNKTVIMETTIV